MLQRHQYFVPYFNGAVDHITTKPLLAIWVKMISIKALGYDELAIRLPSALAGMLSACLVFLFVKKNSSTLWAWCSFCVLITSLGFVHFHTARTGEPDSILTLFLLLSNICFYNYLNYQEHKDRNITLYFLFLALAFGTKSMAALLFIPAHVFMIIYKKNTFNILKQKGFYIGLFLFALLGAFFILSRQINDPAYISSIINNDVSRLVKVNDTHNEPFDFYFNNFYNYRFSCWVMVFLLGIFLLLRQKNKLKLNTISLWCFSLIVSFLFIISFSTTKLEWYDMPLYPYLAIVTGYAMYYLVKRSTYFGSANIMQPFMVLLLFSIPLYFAIKQSYNNDINLIDRRHDGIVDYVFNKNNDGVSLDQYTICDTWYLDQYLFYKYKLNDQGQHINIVDTNSIVPLSKVIVKDGAIKKYIQNKFMYTVIDSAGEVTVFNIGAKK